MSSIKIRGVRAEDADSLIKLYNSIGWKLSERQAHRIVDFSINCDYSKMFIAELNGKIIGKVTLDTVFPPYAEIVNVVVHPNYWGRGIGSKLIGKCINMAVKLNHNIIYLMCDPSNEKVHKFYAKIGFKPAILGNPKKPRNDMWLYYFGKETIVKKFLEKHSFAEFHVSKRRRMFHKLRVYSMKWRDPITEDNLEILVKGQPGQPLKNGTMPRIAGVRLRWKGIKFDCWINDESFKNYRGYFKLNLQNHSVEEKSIKIFPLMREDMKLILKFRPNITLNPKEELSMDGEIQLTKNFEVKLNYLSFPTIIASLTLRINHNLDIIISSGFNPPSARRSKASKMKTEL